MQLIVLFVLHMCLVLFTQPVMAQPLPSAATSAATRIAPADWAGVVKVAVGSVTAERRGQMVTLAVGDRVFALDKIMTGKDSRAAITLRDDTLISFGANSQVLLREFNFDPGTQSGSMVINVLRGLTAFVSGLVAKSSPVAMQVATPTATMGVRGTEFIVEVDQE